MKLNEFLEDIQKLLDDRAWQVQRILKLEAKITRLLEKIKNLESLNEAR